LGVPTEEGTQKCLLADAKVDRHESEQPPHDVRDLRGILVKRVPTGM
jgi:hypothetical protein